MYENGKQVNQYSAKIKHKKTKQRQYTPLNFFSYEDYISNEEKEMLFLASRYDFWAKHEQKREEVGGKQPYERWWKYYSSNWKKNLKHYANRESRQFNREFCNKVMAFAGDFDDFDAPLQNRFNDSWNWD